MLPRALVAPVASRLRLDTVPWSPKAPFRGTPASAPTAHGLVQHFKMGPVWMTYACLFGHRSATRTRGIVPALTGEAAAARPSGTLGSASPSARRVSSASSSP